MTFPVFPDNFSVSSAFCNLFIWLLGGAVRSQQFMQ